MDDRWYSVQEISDYLGVKRDTLYKWIKRNFRDRNKIARNLAFFASCLSGKMYGEIKTYQEAMDEIKNKKAKFW